MSVYHHTGACACEPASNNEEVPVWGSTLSPTGDRCDGDGVDVLVKVRFRPGFNHALQLTSTNQPFLLAVA
eukprot:scaffold77905_cov58-Attheya_sp.AAC.1